MNTYNGYDVVTDVMIDVNVRFVRINPTDLRLSIITIFNSLMDVSWINTFFGNNPVLKDSVTKRAMPTIEKFNAEFQSGTAVAVNKDTGELLVSEISRKTLVERYGYFSMPIGELFKQKVTGNPGFDFFSINHDEIILFGEAKYVSDRTPCKKAFNQIADFIEKGKDSKDMWDVEKFIPKRNEAQANFLNGLKGFVGSFSSKKESDQELIDKIKNLDSYKSLQAAFPEIICIGIDL